MEFDERWAETLRHLRDRRVIDRIRAHDHTVWRPDPTEISNRLGWLDVPRAMARERERFAEISREAHELTDVVVLGMGGSSLGAEVLYRVHEAEGLPRPLHVLDSTVPGQVRAVRDRIDLGRTAFVVSSKSGTTEEVVALRDFFWDEAKKHTSEPQERFVLVSDPGTPLAGWGHEKRVTRMFLNPADIGGRFSVLSFFGLVPAALAGVDVGALLARAEAGIDSTAPEVETDRNPAARLGSFFAAGVAAGRDKLTLLASPRLESFGLWAEQLLAESTGKQGTGILPVAGEPLLSPDEYGADRLFVTLELGEDPALSTLASRLERAGHPTLRRELGSAADLGREMFVWELATAVAGHLLDVQPFDQPNVQSAKGRTSELLRRVEEGGELPEVEAESDLAAALATRPSYVAILAFLPESEPLETAIRDLRSALAKRTGAATTFGYGPRYLHSTGQLHKGGPTGGLFLQLVDGGEDLPIPGRPYGFRTLARAQADGDLRALQDAGRRVVRVEVGPDAAETVRELAEAVRRK